MMGMQNSVEKKGKKGTSKSFQFDNLFSSFSLDLLVLFETTKFVLFGILPFHAHISLKYNIRWLKRDFKIVVRKTNDFWLNDLLEIINEPLRLIVLKLYECMSTQDARSLLLNTNCCAHLTRSLNTKLTISKTNDTFMITSVLSQKKIINNNERVLIRRFLFSRTKRILLQRT